MNSFRCCVSLYVCVCAGLPPLSHGIFVGVALSLRASPDIGYFLVGVALRPPQTDFLVGASARLPVQLQIVGVRVCVCVCDS